MKLLSPLYLMLVLGVFTTGQCVLADTVLEDDFDGSMASADNWHIPTWVSSTDGTYIGRTQIRCTQNASLPDCSNSNVIILLESYNPTGSSFYGTDLITDQTYGVDDGLVITIRAKMESPIQTGTVGGIFLYALNSGSNTLHDEIDFELLGNYASEVQTNVYDSEALGVGHPEFVSLSSGSITDFHTYVIRWLPDQVRWYIDGELLRTETTYVPDGPMYFHLNIWVPSSDWANAYDSSLQPVSSSDDNESYSLLVDRVSIQTLARDDATEETNPFETMDHLNNDWIAPDAAAPNGFGWICDMFYPWIYSASQDILSNGSYTGDGDGWMYLYKGATLANGFYLYRYATGTWGFANYYWDGWIYDYTDGWVDITAAE